MTQIARGVVPLCSPLSLTVPKGLYYAINAITTSTAYTVFVRRLVGSFELTRSSENNLHTLLFPELRSKN